MARKTTYRPRRKRDEAEGARRKKSASGNGVEMAKGMTAVDGLAERKVPPSCNGVVGSQLSKIPGVDAVFVYVDDDGLVHVYSVVPEFSFGLYKRLVKRERIIEETCPQLRFEFHVRAHQGRKAARAVPLGARRVFVR